MTFFLFFGSLLAQLHQLTQITAGISSNAIQKAFSKGLYIPFSLIIYSVLIQHCLDFSFLPIDSSDSNVSLSHFLHSMPNNLP